MILSYNCMECIAASQRPSERVPGFYSGNLICIYCSVATKMNMYWKELLQLVLELTHGQIKEQIVPRLVNGIVVLVCCFFPSAVFSPPWALLWIHKLGELNCCLKVGAGPWGPGSNLSSELSIFFALFMHLMKTVNGTKRCLGAVTWTVPVMSCWQVFLLSWKYYFGSKSAISGLFNSCVQCPAHIRMFLTHLERALTSLFN